MLDLVRNPDCWFSHTQAHISSNFSVKHFAVLVISFSYFELTCLVLNCVKNDSISSNQLYKAQLLFKILIEDKASSSSDKYFLSTAAFFNFIVYVENHAQLSLALS